MADENGDIPPVEPTPTAPPTAPPFAPRPSAPVARTPVLSLLSLIAGIVSVLGSWVAFIPFLGFFLGLWFPAAAVILGFIGRKKNPQPKWMWLTGVILGFVALGIAVLALILWVIVAVRGGFTDYPTFRVNPGVDSGS
jgi:hypothetical protein